MKSLYKNETVLIQTNENGELLPNLQYAFGEFLHDLRLERFSSPYGHINFVDWNTLRLSHNFDL